MMVESEAYELTEEEMLGAVKFGHEAMQPVIDLIIDLAEVAAKEPFDFQPPDYSELYAKVKAAGEAQMRAAFAHPRQAGPHERHCRRVGQGSRTA